MHIQIQKLVDYLSALSTDELNDLCNYMDSPAYEKPWIEIYDSLEVDALEPYPGQKNNFTALSGCTEHHEITSYISDAIDLICMADQKGIDLPFKEYLRDCFVEGNLENLIRD